LNSSLSILAIPFFANASPGDERARAGDIIERVRMRTRDANDIFVQLSASNLFDTRCRSAEFPVVFLLTSS
jgi:hypothetical protein